jgi:DNA-binding MarR family transcriptional regulator
LRRADAILFMDGEPVASFEVKQEQALTTLRARELDVDEPSRRLIAFERSSPEARAVLRERGLSYVGGNGELWIHAPPIHVERPPSRRAASAVPPKSPFSVRAGRVPRWLLLHPEGTPTFRELGGAVMLSESIVSRTLNALADDGLVKIEPDPGDARKRRVRMRDASAMLAALELASKRAARRQTWDIGARDVPEALHRLKGAAKRLQLPYMVGGLAGAALVQRVVEPLTVEAWVERDSLELWREELGAFPARPGPGRLVVQTARDPFVFTLATRLSGFPVADPVQLYLDCRRAGERALEAAEVIRKEMRW